MILIERVEDIDVQKWHSLVRDSVTRSVFQTKEYYDFISSLSIFDVFIYAVEDNGSLRGVVLGYIPKDAGTIKNFFSRRAIIHGGVLLANNAKDEELALLLEALVNGLEKKVIYLEIRNLNDYSKYEHVFKKFGFIYEPHLNFHVDTSSMELVQKNIYKTKRRKINSTLREGVVVDSMPSIDDIRVFYILLRNLYYNKVKKPLFPLKYFENLFEQEFAKFFLIKKDKEIIGGQVVLCLSDDTVYLLFLCGEDGKYNGVFPSILGTYSGIQYAAECGYKKCDMMGAGRPDEDYGVRNFKAEFGGQLVEHGRFRCVLNRPMYALGKLGLKILQKF